MALPFLMATPARAGLLVNESFSGYTGENLVGNTTTALGLTGKWAGSGYFKNQADSLTMTGVASSGGSLALNLITISGKTATVPLGVVLPSTTIHGSYLFRTTLAISNARTVGGVGIGAAADSDNTASFVWAGNGYNSSNGTEGPNVRAEGTGTPLPTTSLVSGQTYLMLYEFDAVAGTTTAWVLNQGQLTNFHASLNAATLNGVTSDTEEPTGVTWRGSVTGSPAGAMSDLLLFGYTPNANGLVVYEWDEIRLSGTSLLEAVTGVQAPASLAILGVSGGPGGFTITYDAGGTNVNIMRSTPGLDNFLPIATGENSGTYTDSSAPAGKAFYRIAPTN